MFCSDAPTISWDLEPASLPPPRKRSPTLIWKDWFSTASSWLVLGRDKVLTGAGGTLAAMLSTLLSIECMGKVGTTLLVLDSPLEVC